MRRRSSSIDNRRSLNYNSGLQLLIRYDKGASLLHLALNRKTIFDVKGSQTYPPSGTSVDRQPDGAGFEELLQSARNLFHSYDHEVRLAVSQRKEKNHQRGNLDGSNDECSRTVFN